VFQGNLLVEAGKKGRADERFFDWHDRLILLLMDFFHWYFHTVSQPRLND
jgi:hypothetical protein